MTMKKIKILDSKIIKKIQEIRVKTLEKNHLILLVEMP